MSDVSFHDLAMFEGDTNTYKYGIYRWQRAYHTYAPIFFVHGTVVSAAIRNTIHGHFVRCIVYMLRYVTRYLEYNDDMIAITFHV